MLRLKSDFHCTDTTQAVDTPKSIFCEILFQRHCGKSEYQDLFGLPITLFVRHPLCLSVGHRHHGSQMRTGWPADPKNLSDRVDEDNNILIESVTVNRAKWDMPESTYPRLIELASSYDVPLSVYNPDLDVSGAVDPAIEFLDDVEEEFIEYDIVELEDDVLGEEDVEEDTPAHDVPAGDV